MSILPTRATLLATRIGDLRDWGIIIFCPCRGFPRHLPLERVADDHGNRLTLESVLIRLRCSRCARVPRRVEARRGDPFATRGMAPIVLLETKSEAQRR